jgi:hypothetical protein
MTEYKLKMYHSCTKEAWDKCISQGYLLHDRKCDASPKAEPCVYLASELRYCDGIYGDVTLEIDFEPDKYDTNYNKGCWQCRVYTPIPLDAVKVLTEASN